MSIDQSYLTITQKQVLLLSKDLKIIRLDNRDMEKCNFNHLKNLVEINFYNTCPTQDQLNQLPVFLEKLDIGFSESILDFSRFKTLKN